MSPSTGSKMRDAGKKTGDFGESEIKKLQLMENNEKYAENCETKSIERVSKSEKSDRRPESSSRYKSTKPVGEVKKWVKITNEKNRSETEAKEKRGGSVIIDKVPKKNAQRAKGSISINKTLKNDESAKKRPVFSADNLPRAQSGLKKEQTGITSKECPPSIQKPNVSDKSLRSSASRKPHKEDLKEGDKKLSTKKKKSWASLTEKISEKVIKKEESQFVNFFQDDDSKNEELSCTEAPPSSSCSFFGKIQQGVKAYFMSRNSLKFDTAASDDKTKKNITEGGINLD